MDNSYILNVLRLCTLGTELCNSAEPHQCFDANDVEVQDVPVHFDAKFCILLSDRCVACSISLNGILSQCVSC
jgi:hypothetical protein